MHVMRNGGKSQRREAFFTLVVDDTENPTFVNISNHVGQTMPFKKPAATCAMRVSPDVVSFSLLRLTKDAAKRVANEPVTLPRAVLARIERRAPKLELAPGKIILEVLLPSGSTMSEEEDDLASLFGDTDAVAAEATAPVEQLGDLFGGDSSDSGSEPATAGPDGGGKPGRGIELEPVTFTLSVDIDDAGIAEVTCDDTVQFAMPRGALKCSVYLYSSSVQRTLGISFIGHLPGKPGGLETPERVTAQVLHLLAKLAEFRVLSGIEDVRIPAKPGGKPRTWTETKPPSTISVEAAVSLYQDPNGEGVDGTIRVELDTQSANERFLFHIDPDAAIAELFEPYRPIVTQWVTQTVENMLGPSNAYQSRLDIILGELSLGMREELERAVASLAQGAMFTTSQYRGRN